MKALTALPAAVKPLAQVVNPVRLAANAEDEAFYGSRFSQRCQFCRCYHGKLECTPGDLNHAIRNPW